MSRNYDCLTIRLQKGKLKLYIFIFGVCKINNGKGDYFMKQYKKCMCMLLTTAMVSQLAISASGANAAAKPKLSTKSVKVTAQNIQHFLGTPVYRDDVVDKKDFLYLFVFYQM